MVVLALVPVGFEPRLKVIYLLKDRLITSISFLPDHFILTNVQTCTESLVLSAISCLNRIMVQGSVPTIGGNIVD